MPTMPKTANAVTAENTADILNALASDPNDTRLAGAPRVIAGDTASLRNFGSFIMSYTATQNAFVDALVNRIGRVLITSRLYENPLRMFKRGIMELGETIEEIFVEMANPYQYDPEKDYETVWKRYPPNVQAAFHHLNFQKYYPLTVERARLQQAFLSWEGMADIVSRMIEQVYTGANYDEFIAMKYEVARLALGGYLKSVNIPTVTASNARSVTSTMVAYANQMRFMSNQYNYAGVTTYTDPSFLYMLITAELSAIFDVEVLALSFNMSKAELIGRQVMVDGFGTFDNERLALLADGDPGFNFTPFTDAEITQLKTISGVMLDERFFVFVDVLREMKEIENPKTLGWNYFYHVWQVISASPFANCVVFTTQNPAITAVNVTPKTPSVTAGLTVQFSADVTTSGFADKSVTWSVTDTKKLSSISQDGLLSVDAAHAAGSITVTATSKYDPTKSASTTVTVVAASA